MELGIYTFAEVGIQDGEPWAQAAERRLAQLVEEMELADRLGLDVFGVGEHHRPDYAVSSPVVALAAGASRTERIRLTSAVTVLSSDDPVRVFQDFATLDLLSNGRAEIMAGRGSFIESFPLFGLDLDDYDDLFADKLERLLAVRAGNQVNGLDVYPRPLQDPLPVWLAVGGNPPSAIRAGSLGLPMALAIIGGEPARFAPLVDLYRRAGGTTVSINSHTYVADTDEQAADEFFPSYSGMMNRIGRERGWSGLTRDDYAQLRSLRGALVVGSVDEVVEKILYQHALFGHTRFLAQTSLGTLPHDLALRSIELFGREVAPRVREAVAARAAQAETSR
jgi:probable LLM family oxidoreductase